jgi:hypothetical protein
METADIPYFSSARKFLTTLTCPYHIFAATVIKILSREKGFTLKRGHRIK